MMIMCGGSPRHVFDVWSDFNFDTIFVQDVGEITQGRIILYSRSPLYRFNSFVFFVFVLNLVVGEIHREEL